VIKASSFFSVEEKEQIAAAVAEAEKRTAGEIVPVLATASGRYDRAEDLFGVVFASLLLVAVWWSCQGLTPAAAGWGGAPGVSLGLFPVLLVVIGGFLLGTLLATRVPALRLPFLSSDEMREEVEKGAAAAFQRLRVRRTEEGTGVLIYVSLYERMVRVLGDDAVEEKLSAADWQGVCDEVLAGLKEGRGADGLVRGIGRAGDLLATYFPPVAGDRNELNNRLRCLD